MGKVLVFCLSARLAAAAAVISAYLNCELITSSRFSLSSVHYCFNPHENQSILGIARSQNDDSPSLIMSILPPTSVYILIYCTVHTELEVAKITHTTLSAFSI